jgi:hypothetical protein
MVAYAGYARHRQTRHLPLVRDAHATQLVCRAPGCGKVYTRADHLARHRRSHEPTVTLACPDCPFRTVRPDTLARHAREHRLEQAELRLAASILAADRLRAQLAQAQRAVDHLRQERDHTAAAEPALAPAQPGGRCSCGVTDQPALLGAVVRCAAPRCPNRFHFVCAGYAFMLVNANRLALCAACRQQAGWKPETVERADREVALLCERIEVEQRVYTATCTRTWPRTANTDTHRHTSHTAPLLLRAAVPGCPSECGATLRR